MSDVKASILVVDDDLAIRELLHKHLSRVGYDVMTAAESARASSGLMDGLHVGFPSWWWHQRLS